MYNHSLIEKKWQKIWKENNTFQFVDNNKPKFYVLDMFPYPSGKGLHVGHPKGYTATDVISRFKRLKGFNVLHPIGWDAFGLPAEQYAIETNNHPNDFTLKNIDNFRSQLQKLGFDYDYSKEVNTSNENYYKWTQWIFVQLFKHGLAEIKDIDVNWCEELKTTLSNEEVITNAKGVQVSERGNYPVIKKPMRQWVLKITKYADKLLEGLNDVDWPESLKSLQRNWIGKMEGYEIKFDVNDENNSEIDVFTTRIDTIFGITYICLNPKHPLVKKWQSKNLEINNFVNEYLCKSSRELSISKIKNGIFSNHYAVHPITKKLIPIWIGDYVLENVGTGAIMGVPAHDERDFEFAKKYKIDIKYVIETNNHDEPYLLDGKHINSEFLNDLNIKDAINKVVEYFKDHNWDIKKVTTYKMKDWVFSRQRYWGEPFPILFDENNNIILDENLPIKLPKTNDFKPSDDGQSPLNKITDFINVNIGDKKYKRDSNTMPQWAGSCWYYLAYILKTKNENEYIDLNSKQAYDLFKRWLPVDIYIGGQEHAVLHLLYARFWHRFLYDIGIVPTKEPFYKIINQGMILGTNGEKMSKSKGNVINPDEIIDLYGADALRLYEVFMGPLTATLPWTNEGINGVRKWLDRVYRYFVDIKKEFIDINSFNNQELIYDYNNFIKNVTYNLENQNFNLAVSDMMIFMNSLYKHNQVPIEYLKSFLIVLSCFSPHIAEELWSSSLKQNGSVCLQDFPKYDESKLILNKINIPFQINGKLKLVLELNRDLDDNEVINIIESDPRIKKLIENKKIDKKIIVKNKIINYLINNKEN